MWPEVVDESIAGSEARYFFTTTGSCRLRRQLSGLKRIFAMELN